MPTQPANMQRLGEHPSPGNSSPTMECNGVSNDVTEVTLQICGYQPVLQVEVSRWPLVTLHSDPHPQMLCPGPWSALLGAHVGAGSLGGRRGRQRCLGNQGSGAAPWAFKCMTSARPSSHRRVGSSVKPQQKLLTTDLQRVASPDLSSIFFTFLLTLFFVGLVGLF